MTSVPAYLINHYSVSNEQSILLAATATGIRVGQVWEPKVHIEHLTFLGYCSALWPNEESWLPKFNAGPKSKNEGSHAMRTGSFFS